MSDDSLISVTQAAGVSATPMACCVQVLDSPGFSAGNAAGAWSAEAIKLAVQASEQAERALLVAVRRAREDGHTWSDIGHLLGTTTQAAHSRFAKKIAG